MDGESPTPDVIYKSQFTYYAVSITKKNTSLVLLTTFCVQEIAVMSTDVNVIIEAYIM